MSSTSSNDLIAAANAGSDEALQALIVRFHERLRGAIQHQTPARLRPHLDADDVLQQAYITVFNRRDVRFESLGGVYKWLETIALSRLADARRYLGRQKRDVARNFIGHNPLVDSCRDIMTQLPDAATSPSRQLGRNEAVAAMLSSLARLSEDRRTVLRMRFLEQRSVAEIAETLGKSEGSVHQLCSRGLQDLREILGPLSNYLSQV